MAQRSKGDATYVPARFDFWGRKVVGPERPEPIVILLGIIFLVLFPAFVTIIAPTSRVSLAYDGKSVSAAVQPLVFLTIPYRTTRLAAVTRVKSRSTPGELVRDESTPGVVREIRSEDSSALVLSGAGRGMSVLV